VEALVNWKDAIVVGVSGVAAIKVVAVIICDVIVLVVGKCVNKLVVSVVVELKVVVKYEVDVVIVVVIVEVEVGKNVINVVVTGKVVGVEEFLFYLFVYSILLLKIPILLQQFLCKSEVT
jgi:hypothetical protein